MVNDVAAYADALAFIEAFPEASAFNVCILTTEKRPVFSQSRCSRDFLLKHLAGWLALYPVHIFVRPVIPRLIMIDLDNFNGAIDMLYRLNPRALVCTSSGNYQMWLVATDDISVDNIPWITTRLTEVLRGDPRSAKPTQQGRFPGSRNVKKDKHQVVVLMQSAVQYMKQLTVLGACQYYTLPTCSERFVSEEPKPATIKRYDASSIDFAMCCCYFEENPANTEEQAEKELRHLFQATRRNQRYYNLLTIRKCLRHVRGKKEQ